MKKPSFLVLYAASSKLTDQHQPLITTAGTIFIRAVESRASLEHALDNAEPMPGEVVLNSIHSTIQDEC